MSTYKDISSTLESDASGSVKLDVDEDVIAASIKTFFATIVGERVRSRYGSTILKYLFQPLNVETAGFIKDEIFDSLPYYEPRLNLQGVQVKPNLDTLTFEVSIRFSVRGIPNARTFRTRLRSFTGRQ